MANKVCFMGMLALVLVFGMTVVGCDNDSTNDNGGNPQTVTYTSISGGTTYTLKITENTTRYTAQNGDSYTLTAGGKTSTGTVSNITDGVLTLKPSNSSTTFVAAISGSSLSALNGTITWTDNTTATAPGEMTGGNGNPSAPDTVYLRLDSLEHQGYQGQPQRNWSSGSDVNLASFYSGKLKNNTVYMVRLQGTTDKELNKFRVDFFREAVGQPWAHLGDTRVEMNSTSSSVRTIPAGDFEQTYYITTNNDAASVVSNSKNIAWFCNFQFASAPFGDPLHYDLADGTLMATITNFSMTVTEVNSNNGNGNGTGGTFTLTGIPSQYNEKYAVLEGSNEDDVWVLGAQSISLNVSIGRTFTAVPISGGSVSLPMWTWINDYTFERYSGNHTVDVAVLICDSATFVEEPDVIGGCEIDSVTFLNGSATKSWNDARRWSE